MKDTSFIIKCTLPDKKAADTALSDMNHENIDTGKTVVYRRVFNENSSFNREAYNVPVFFGALTDFSQNTTPDGNITSAIIMGNALTDNTNDESVCFSMPVNGSNLKKTVLILKRNRARGMKAEKL